MKKHIFYFIICSLLTLFVSSCGISSYDDDTVKVSDSLGYKKLVGTYIFKPTGFQAERLNVDSNSSITLTLEAKNYQTNKGIEFKGKYHISKMIFIKDLKENGPYSNKWLTFYSRDTLNNHNINVVTFEQGFKNGNDMSFEIHRNIKDNSLHILGFTSDPKYEVIKIVDFKKIK